MLQENFTHNGVKYNTGSLISFRIYDYRARGSYITEVKFLYFDTDTQMYFIEVNGKQYSYNKELFFRNLQHKPNCGDIGGTNQTRQRTFSDELNVDGLLIAWIWYIIIMLIGTIFYARIGIWIAASLIFFNYRNKILKEAGYK